MGMCMIYFPIFLRILSCLKEQILIGKLFQLLLRGLGVKYTFYSSVASSVLSGL